MLSVRHRFPSRGSMSAPAALGRGAEGPMVTLPPAEAPIGVFRGKALPIVNLVGTAIRELQLSMLDSDTAIRLGGTSAQPRYFGTVLPSPTTWLSPTDINTEDQVRAAVVNGGNAPQMMNKTAAQGAEPRIARDLPQRRR